MTDEVPAPRQGFAVWFTGLSGSGKTTLARRLRERLGDHRGTVVLDGDEVRKGLCADLGYSAADRRENVRRVAEVAALLTTSGHVALVALISPMQADRQMARELFPTGRFVEVFCDAPLEVCERRDVKGLYRRARTRELAEFTGVSAPYEPPVAPDVVVDTARQAADASVDVVVAHLRRLGLLDGFVRPGGGSR
jgi:adenylylsulfate kinase